MAQLVRSIAICSYFLIHDCTGRIYVNAVDIGFLMVSFGMESMK